MTIDTQKLRELESKATAGPWHTKTECPGRCCWHVFPGMPMYGGVPDSEDGTQDWPIVMGECGEEDAAFMVEARNQMRGLLDHIDSQQSTLDRVTAFVASDALAISYQSLGEYRTALLRMLREAQTNTEGS